MAHLNLDENTIASCRESAKKIADDVQEFVDKRATVSTERTILRLYGVDGVTHDGVPLPNVLVDEIKRNSALPLGAAYYVANACLNRNIIPQEVAEKVARGELDIIKMPRAPYDEIIGKANEMARPAMQRIKENRQTRERMLKELGEGQQPYLYVIVATGNIYEDVVQAQAAARQGADIIAVIRSTGQSLLDYVPYGATTEGFGGTFATQENFRIMRSALDDVSKELGRYIRLVNYASGLCMPEIAAMGALERLDVMLNDALYGILFRDINMQRTLVDQFFSRVINGFSGIIINTGEDNYLTTADAVEAAHTVLASDFINEQFALAAGIPPEQMGLGHAFEMDPDLTDGFLYEVAQAQMIRQIFPKAPIKYMPPTKYMTGNIFKGHIQDAMFNIAAIMTHQGIQLLGMLTEAIHTPFLQDRYLSIENAKYIFNNMKHLGDDIEFKNGGIIETRAKEVLNKSAALLKEMETKGLFKSLEDGIFADVKRSFTGGKGLDGVFVKDEKYINPFIPLMLGGENE
ncbi:MAG: lysine 5,6-aminomutase subunit alpha [Thermoanaerobacteraceae bacterium]|nr:lysine 5,6-aminomutase subunit alpha [Thermoanaerobacteraceae bacterium]